MLPTNLAERTGDLNRAWSAAWAAIPGPALADAFEDALTQEGEDATAAEIAAAQYTALAALGFIDPANWFGAYIVPADRRCWDHEVEDCADCNSCD